jgi:type I restriction enzyme R subunit
VWSGPSEARTRAERIDLQLAAAGWQVPGIDLEVEYEIGSLSDPDHGFTDYALPDDDGSFLAIVEAKRSSRDAIAGKEQAALYATTISIRGGRRPFVFLANGDEIWFWDGWKGLLDVT